MQIDIKVLNVNDGDAIIVVLKKGSESLLLLIDGGNASFAKMIIEQLNAYSKILNKPGPDIILCTHYDSDHIGGLYEVINYFRNSIKQVFIHRTQSILNIPKIIQQMDGLSDSILPSESDLVLNWDASFMPLFSNDELNFVIESIKQELALLELIDNLGIPSAEPIALSTQLIQDWPEVEILGPTLEYYRKLFPHHFDSRDFIEKEANLIKDNLDVVIKEDLDLSPLDRLEKMPKSRVTSPNLNSAILRIRIGDKSFLFTGDAGIESFQNIPDYATTLKDIFWLKVPHHGSKNNIDTELIRIMSPRISAVSGDRYISNEVIECLSQIGSDVEVTRDTGNHLNYSFTF